MTESAGLLVEKHLCTLETVSSAILVVDVEFWDEGRQTMNGMQPLWQSITVTVEATEFETI